MGKELYTNIPSVVGDLINDVKNGRTAVGGFAIVVDVPGSNT